MAGFFGLFDYTKEGKGVYPDEPPKGPIPTFFSILGRKFWKICTINILYLIFSLPALILSVFGAMYITSMALPNMTVDSMAKLFQDIGITLKEGITFQQFAASQMMIIYVVLGMLLTGLSLVIAGPVHAGVTYLLRNYSREEHAFVWMDFKDHARKNLKQSLISSLISILVLLAIVINFSFYGNTEIITSEIARTLLQTVVVVLFVLWCIIQMYLYPMMVTFDLPLKALYKNSLLFSMLRLPMNVLILLLSLIIMLVIPGILFLIGYGISVLAAIIWYLCFAFALNLLMTNFFVYRGLDRYMLQKSRDTEALNAEDEEDTAAAPEAPEDTETAADDDKKNEKSPEPGGLVQSPYGSRP